MLRLVRSLFTVAGTASGLVLVGAVTTAASACGGAATACAPETNGSSVSVSVTGSFVRGGSPGSTGGGTTTVRVPVPCVFYQGWTGKEYFDGVEAGTINGAGSDRDTRDGPWQPYDGYQQHKDDTEGHWYFPGCSNVNDLPWDDFVAFTEDFFAANSGVYVVAGGAPPVPPVPPEVLLQAAEEAMEVPQPAFEFNPDAAGTFDTLVNLDTWFWLTDPVQSGSVTATAGTNSVTVEAALADVVFSAPNAGAVPCAGTGVAWQPGASSECVLAFERAGAAEVTADTRWTVTWSFNGQPQGAVEPLSATFTQTVGVAESQALVTAVD